jgi:hypothetical protein
MYSKARMSSRARELKPGISKAARNQCNNNNCIEDKEEERKKTKDRRGRVFSPLTIFVFLLPVANFRQVLTSLVALLLWPA